MKHLLNNMSEEEKNSIREQHTGGMKVMTENFSKLLNSKLGDSKPLTEQTSPKPDVSCLENAGYKKGKDFYGINNNGEKIPYEGVYEGTYNGNSVSLNKNGFVFYKNNKYEAKWKCKNGNLVIYDVKSVPQMKVPF